MKRTVIMRAERRRHPRAPLLATAVLLDAEGPLGSYRVVNASARGALLAGEVPDVERAVVVMRLSPQRTVRAEAVVVRGPEARGPGVFAVRFVHLAADDQDALQDAVLEVLEAARSASVLIVDGNVEISHALREAVGRLGQQAFAVGTPLEAVHALEQPNSFRVALVDVGLAGGALGLAPGREVMGYLAEQHPRLRRVLMAGNVSSWQIELARKALLPYLPHDILVKPWTEETLAKALNG